ncbi:hypothetical protein V2J09_000422 [Rumex salicifolius]
MQVEVGGNKGLEGCDTKAMYGLYDLLRREISCNRFFGLAARETLLDSEEPEIARVATSHPSSIAVNPEQVIDGLDKAVRTMKKGEVAQIIIHLKYAFGSSESKQELVVVPANAAVIYEVEMVSFVKAKCLLIKEEENVLFKVEKYERASKRYKKVVSFIEYDFAFSEDEKKQAKALKITCNFNNDASKLKLEEYKQAEKLCTNTLEIDSKNVKALYGRAQAYIQLVDLDLAEIDIKKALEIVPENNASAKQDPMLMAVDSKT